MSNLIWILLPAITAAVLSALLTPLVARLAVAIGAVDMPGERKVHTGEIPRLGGLSVVTSIAVVLAAAPLLSRGRWQLPSHLATGLALGVLPVFLISLVDDVRGVRAWRKLIAHTLGAIVAVSFGISLGSDVHLFGTPIHIGFLAAPISVLWIVGVTNAFNIIDGLDGLAAGLALISAAGMAAVFVILGQAGMAGVALVLAGALAGFLPYNVHPARLFLGDTGATAIGFCLAVLALKGGSTLSSGFAALLPVFILGLPIADTLIAIVRRTLGRLENRSGGMFVADSNHIHHRLMSLGMDHGRAVLLLYGAGVLLAGAAFLSVFLSAREAGLFVVALVLAAFVGVHRLGYDEFALIKRGTVLKVYEMPAVKRGMFVVFVDLLLAVVTAYLAVGLKTDQWHILAIRQSVIELSTAFAPVTVLVFWWSGMYRGSWRVAGIQDLSRACTAVAIVTVLGTTLVQVLGRAEYPLSLFVIYGLIALMLTTGLRASYVILEGTMLRKSHQGMPVLIYGAGARGVAAVRELFQNSTAGLRPIGFIDDDARMRGKLVQGLPVFGTERDLARIIAAEGARALVVATENISADRLDRAAEVCKQASVSLFRLDVTVERLSDGGAPVPLDSREAALARDKPLNDAVPAPIPIRSESAPSLDSREAALARDRPALATLHLLGCEPCPSCGGREVFRSKARTLYEKLRKMHTPKRIFRCHDCGWRGWAVPLAFATTAFEESATIFDLTSLDGALPQPVPSAHKSRA